MTLEVQERRGFDIRDVELDEGYCVGDICSIEQCEEAMISLSLRIAAIQGQIDNAKHLAMSSDQYSDRVWWRKVNAALKINKAARQHVQNLRGQLRRQYTQDLKSERDQKLINALRAYVGESVFLNIAATIE